MNSNGGRNQRPYASAIEYKTEVFLMAAMAEQCELAFRQVSKYSSHSNDSATGWACDRNRFYPVIASSKVTGRSWHDALIDILSLNYS